MIGSMRMKRLLVVRERVRDAERASEEARARALELASSTLEARRREAVVALDALGAAAPVTAATLALLAQARAESLVRERSAEEDEREAREARDAQRDRRHVAERDVKLAELARARAAGIEAFEAEREELRTSDDRAAVVHHRGEAHEIERRAR